MKLYLKNHTERYPVEQLQLQLFAQEPSEFCTCLLYTSDAADE